MILSSLSVVAILSATLLYCYPDTLGELSGGLAWIHEWSGNLAVAASGVYLWIHLGRVWPMKRLKISRYSGLILVALWLLSAGTGIYGQVVEWDKEGTLYLVHVFSSVFSVALSCSHGAWAYRPKFRPTET